MHWTSGYTGSKARCGAKRGILAIRDQDVTCSNCMVILREYRTHFPQAHPNGELMMLNSTGTLG